MSDQQFHLELPIMESRAEEDFFVSESNRPAVGLIEAWPDWPGGALALAGPAASGKSHLAAIWAERAGAIVLEGPDLTDPAEAAIGAKDVLVENAHKVASEEALLHIFNWTREQKGSLLLTGVGAPTGWPIKLPDLASRLATVTCAEIDLPDDALLGAVISKRLADRQVRVSGAVIEYVLRRMERSFEAAARVVETLDRLALAEGRAITIPLARKMFENLS